jgi:hypothetical protein
MRQSPECSFESPVANQLFLLALKHITALL